MKNKLLKYIAELKKRAEEKRDEAAFEKNMGAHPYLVKSLKSEAAELEKVVKELEDLIKL